MKTESKNNKLPILIAVSLLVFAMLACGKSVPSENDTNGGENSDMPNLSNGNSISHINIDDDIVPGTTTREDVVKLLGDPVRTEEQDEFETLLYPSTLPGQYNSVVLKDHVVTMAAFIMDDDNFLKLSDIFKEYGPPQKTSYNNYLAGSMTYIYPYLGQAFVASEEMDSVFIRQYFEPTLLSEYMSTWGASLPSDDPFIK